MLAGEISPESRGQGEQTATMTMRTTTRKVAMAMTTGTTTRRGRTPVTMASPDQRREMKRARRSCVCAICHLV